LEHSHPIEKKKTTAIEANDLSTLTLENLVGNLMAYKVQLQDRKKDELQPKKKVLAFKASLETEDSDDEEDVAVILRKFKKILRKGKFKKNKDINDSPLCYCNKPGHMKKNCPLLKPKANFNKI